MPELLCPKCDHPLTLNPERGIFHCENCGFKRPETLDEAAERIRAARAVHNLHDVPITHRGTLDYRARSLFEDGQAKLQRGDTAAALDAFRDALDLQPDFTDAHLWIAKLSDDEAVKRDHLSEIIARDPGNLDALRMLMVLNKEITPEEAELSRDNRRTPAIRQIDEAVAAQTTALLCPVCGGTLTIDEANGRVVCKFCGHTEPLDAQRHASEGAEILGSALIKRRIQPVKWIVGKRILHCNQCGAERTIPARRLASRCPFCGSQQVIEQDALNTIEQPDGLLPFTVSEEEAKAAIRERLKGIGERIAGWFDDNRVVNAAVEGVYLPYWVFDALVEVSKTTIDRRTSSLYERHQPINPYLNEKYNDGLIGISIPAVTSPAPDLTGQIGAFDTSAVVAYEPKLLARYPAALYDIDFDDAALSAQSAAADQMRARYKVGESSSVEVSVFTMVRQMSFTLLLLPVWVITLFERDGDVRPTLVNGQTGKVALGKAIKAN